MSGSSDLPTGRRVVRAALVAAFAATAGTTLFNVLYVPPAAIWNAVTLFLFVGFQIAALHAFLIGVPVYLLLRRVRPLRWGNAALAGFLIGAIPLLALSGLIGPYADFYRVGSTVLVQDGRYTATGWWSLLAQAAGTGFAGLIGGLSFRAMLR